MWLSDYVIEINIAYCLLMKDGESLIFYETLNNLDIILRVTAMQEKIEALHKNKT